MSIECFYAQSLYGVLCLARKAYYRLLYIYYDRCAELSEHVFHNNNLSVLSTRVGVYNKLLHKSPEAYALLSFNSKT